MQVMLYGEVLNLHLNLESNMPDNKIIIQTSDGKKRIEFTEDELNEKKHLEVIVIENGEEVASKFKRIFMTGKRKSLMMN